MPAPLYDHQLRAMRRDRAVRIGAETFLYDRAFDDCLERLGDIQGEFNDVLLAGCPNPDWPRRLGPRNIGIIDPGPLMADRAGGQCADLECLPFEAEQFDLCITVGLLDTANNLPLAAAALHLVLKPGGLLLGAVAGGQCLPRLRHAMAAADRPSRQATPHVHPRIDPPSLGQLLTGAGFTMPVIDVDTAEIAYPSLSRLVGDLRAMGATNILLARSKHPIGRAGLQAASLAFADNPDGKPRERVDIVHFAAWKGS